MTVFFVNQLYPPGCLRLRHNMFCMLSILFYQSNHKNCACIVSNWQFRNQNPLTLLLIWMNSALTTNDTQDRKSSILKFCLVYKIHNLCANPPAQIIHVTKVRRSSPIHPSSKQMKKQRMETRRNFNVKNKHWCMQVTTPIQSFAKGLKDIIAGDQDPSSLLVGWNFSQAKETYTDAGMPADQKARTLI